MSDAVSPYVVHLAEAWADYEVLLRRFQALSAQAWESRRTAVLHLLGRLIEVSGDLENRDMPPLPDIASFALPDAFAVICGDALAAIEEGRNDVVLSDVLDELRRARVATG